jgi:hypothetical protein
MIMGSFDRREYCQAVLQTCAGTHVRTLIQATLIELVIGGACAFALLKQRERAFDAGSGRSGGT